MAVQTEREPQTVGELIRFWRTQRWLTQMELALDANLSTKHLSFVETGRSRPSLDGLWNLIEANRAASLLWDGVDPELLEPPVNMLRLGVGRGE